MKKAIALLPFYIAIILCIASCKKELSGSLQVGGSKPFVDSTIHDTTRFIDFTLDGKRIFQLDRTSTQNTAWQWFPASNWTRTSPDNHYYYNSSVRGGLNKDVSTYLPSFYFLKNSYGLSFASVQGITAFGTTDLKVSFVDSFLRTGSYAYAASLNKDTSYTANGQLKTQTLLSDGIQLSWIDSAGKVWQTTRGSADQTGSYFTVTENHHGNSLSTDSNPAYSYFTVVAANFGCNLYDDNGHVMKLTNGRFRLKIFFYPAE